MGCVQSYFKRAHNAGISPSSTQESNSKQPISEDGTKPVQEERSITEEPESNDTSYGVEATAVRTLAATTGTVAILGTTAKTAEKKEGKEEGSSEAATPVVVDTIPEEQEEPPSSVEQAVVHEEDKRDSKASEKSSGPASANSRPTSSHLEDNDKKEAADPSPPASSNEPKESTPSESSEAIKSPLPNSNKSETASPEVKSPVSPPDETESKIAEEVATESVVSESTKDKEEDISKSISSERLKTNSLSNTTLSSDSIAEIENASVKQSPSVEKVIESFDSSSTVEFVDIATKDSPKADDTATNPARSISSDLSNKANLPVDGEKTPDVTSPVEPEEKLYEEELPPPPPPETEDTSEAQIPNDTIQSPPNLEKTEITEDSSVKETDQEEVDANSLSKDQQNEEPSLNSELTSNTSNSIQSVLKNEEAQDINSKSAIENNSPNASEEVKAETGSPFSTDNNSSLNDNGDASPVKTVTSSPAPEISEDHKEEIKPEVVQSPVPDKSESTQELTNGLASRNETPIEKTPVNEQISKPSVEEVLNSTEGNESKTPGNEVNGEIPDDVFGSPIDLTDEKVVAAATTIQATFRGFQTRQNLKADEKGETDEKPVSEPVENEVKKSAEIVEETPLNSVSEGFDSTTEQPSSILEDVDDKMIAAATTIQANFRGYQTRQILQNRDSALPTSEDTNQSSERKTPTALTPELIESVKEEVDDICKEAEIIAAERAESVEGMVAGVHQVVVEAKESTTLPSVSESVQAVRGSVTPPSVSDAGAEDVDNYDGKEEVFDSLPTDEKTVHAATTIQASFRGFQVRKNLQDNQEQPDSMPDYPPPAEDDLMPSLDDLPPPDFEALESSYSEDAPTEPLAPPPPPDSVIFNEEDEDELMSLQQLQRPPECDELPEHRLTVDTDSSESSLSSAATKIQAGVRGYLTRKQMQAQGDTGGTTSTSTNVLDSDQSLSVSREEDGVRSAISTEEESEVCRHVVSPDSDTIMEMEVPRSSRSATKRMSLGSNAAELPPARQRAPLRTAMSVQGPVPVSDDDVWNTLKGEMSDAATRIQSNFRGYRARKQLQREDAMQVTSSSSQATGSSGSPAGDAGRVSAASEVRDVEDTVQTARTSGEYHDIIALTPPSIQTEGSL
ncbi:histone acetyltransferase KAT6A-like isoform X2 [Homalodisca vitripennis]|uniref:histone acetyltransferase KAT6A-like isoform X2 n=1 Tax=Homalodisca vitripennis TaxID=197043 RepID=UPI001EE9B4D9|nr:histone acetyltransferase KAT6A-like isoform X2 [Homalodisca vitripennis]